MATTCSVPGCTKPARAAGQCTSHYQRARRLARGESAPELEQPLRDRDRPKVFARVARATKGAIDAEAKVRGIPPYRVAAEVLDGWARDRILGDLRRVASAEVEEVPTDECWDCTHMHAAPVRPCPKCSCGHKA